MCIESINELYAELDDLRSFNKDFDALVSEIDSKFESFIEEKSRASFRPRTASSCSVNIKVSAVPITAKEQECLIKYLNYKYIDKHLVGGGRLDFRKCLFSKKYQIKSYYYSDF